MPVYGARLSERRLALNMSQQDVCDAIKIKSTQQFDDWEKGRHAPSIKHLEKLAPALKCSIDYLVGLTDDPGATLEERDLSEDEVALVRAKREGRYKEAINYLLSDTPPTILDNLPGTSIESKSQSSITGNDEAA